eukprot:m.893037 g.893037  ORF g.893037 m.893037 type:complete len:201 (+) comp23657_c0_seq1:352-954(+)
MGASASASCQSSSFQIILNNVPKNTIARAESALRRGGYLDVVQNTVHSVETKNTGTTKEKLQDIIQTQVEALLVRSNNEYSTSVSSKRKEKENMQNSTRHSSDLFTLRQTSAHETGHMGEGVFLQGCSVTPGTVLAFFPGVSYLNIPPGATIEDPAAPWKSDCSWEDNDKTIDRFVTDPLCRVRHCVHYLAMRKFLQSPT